MNLNFYKDETEREIRTKLEVLQNEVEDYALLAQRAENQQQKEILYKIARTRKADMKWLVKSYYEKNPTNTLLECISKEILLEEKHNPTRDNCEELKHLAHIKNIIRKGRWVSTKKPTDVKADEFCR